MAALRWLAAVAPMILIGSDLNAAVTVDAGGFVRGNLRFLGYVDGRDWHRGDLDFDAVLASVSIRDADWELVAKYRWYQHYNTVQQFYVAYSINPTLELQLGVTPVPFGLLPLASHSFWEGVTNPLGLEDDSDLGAKLTAIHGSWTLHAAWFRSTENANDDAGSYSYDLVSSGDQANTERDTFNLRSAYGREFPSANLEAGISLLAGKVRNDHTRRDGRRIAVALHLDATVDNWHFQSQWIRYDYDLENPAGIDRHSMQMGGLGFTFMAAAGGDVATLNAAYTFFSRSHIPSLLRCYHDFSRLYPAGPGQDPSSQNVIGCVYQRGPFTVYADWIAGDNMVSAGGQGLGLPESSGWEHTVNFNIGWYF